MYWKIVGVCVRSTAWVNASLSFPDLCTSVSQHAASKNAMAQRSKFPFIHDPRALDLPVRSAPVQVCTPRGPPTCWWYSVFGPFFAKCLLDDPNLLWRRVRLRPGWCGTDLMLFLKSLGVGLDRLESTRHVFGGGGGGVLLFLGFFLSFLAIFGHFWPKCRW